MSKLPCPHCKEDTISWWDKYKAAKWAIIYCAKCNGRCCSQPFILVFYTMLYVWDVMLFGYLYYLTKIPGYLITLIVLWIILDIFSVYLPINALKRKQPPPTETEK